MTRIRDVFGAALILVLAGCAGEKPPGPSVVTKVEYVYPELSRSLFDTEPFPDWPPRPVALKPLIFAFEEGGNLYGICQAKLEEIWLNLQPPPATGGTPP